LNLTKLEHHFQQLQAQLGALADDQTFSMIYSLIEQNRQLRTENDKLTVLNRHYYHHFYNGNIDKMIADFQYLMGE
jgi:regulator of replication initiation timing